MLHIAPRCHCRLFPGSSFSFVLVADERVQVTFAGAVPSLTGLHVRGVVWTGSWELGVELSLDAGLEFV